MNSSASADGQAVDSEGSEDIPENSPAPGHSVDLSIAKEAAARVMASAKTIIIDLDGVLFAGERPINGAIDAVRALGSAGFSLGYLTNSSGRSGVETTRKLVTAGFPVESGCVHTCFDEAVDVMSEIKLLNGVFVVGSQTLRDALASNGVMLSSPELCDQLLVGLDTNFDYATLADAMTAALRGVPFIACNRDPNYPAAGRLLPGCGPIVVAIEAGSGRPADRILGKPEPAFLRRLLTRMGASIESTVVIGDSLKSDIALARACGAASVHITRGKNQVVGAADVAVRSIHEFAQAAGVMGAVVGNIT